MEETKRKVISIYPDGRLRELIESICKEENRNKNNLICHILEKELPKYKK